MEQLFYIIVLGAQVRGTTMSKALWERTNKALEVLQKNPQVKAVLSGGQGSDEEISEAQAMYDYLTAHGIAYDRLILEDRSTNTRENMQFSFALLGDPPGVVGVVTNRFHLFRSVAIGKKLGHKNLVGIGAPYRSPAVVKNTIREFFAIIKDKLAGNI